MDERDLLGEVMEVLGKDCCLDDCAVIPWGEGFLVATTDMLHRSTDFPEAMSDWQIGWMATAVTLSDIASMAAQPAFLLLAVGLDRPDRLREIMRGARDCAARYGTSLVGGDLDHHNELTLVSTGVGVVDREGIVRRSGSHPGDLIAVTGVPGRAQAALEGVRRHERCLFEPRPRVEEGRALGKAGVSAMIDTSDGIALSLYDLLAANPCGYEIHEGLVPLPEEVEDHGKALDMALFGGGDYQLLFTCPAERMPIQNVSYTVIGEAIPSHEVLIDGRPLGKRGYQHVWPG
jgi:thiamine-monophosphate kinase